MCELKIIWNQLVNWVNCCCCYQVRFLWINVIASGRHCAHDAITFISRKKNLSDFNKLNPFSCMYALLLAVTVTVAAQWQFNYYHHYYYFCAIFLLCHIVINQIASECVSILHFKLIRNYTRTIRVNFGFLFLISFFSHFFLLFQFDSYNFRSCTLSVMKSTRTQTHTFSLHIYRCESLIYSLILLLSRIIGCISTWHWRKYTTHITHIKCVSYKHRW